MTRIDAVPLASPRRREWLLAFDTSTPVAVIACGRLDEAHPRATFALGAGANQASEGLADRIVETVRAAGLEPSMIDAIAVGRGPGTFTGTRVALATAKGMALGRSLRLHPLSTLACVAASLPDTLATIASPANPTPAHAAVVLALLDARKGEVYAGRFLPPDAASAHARAWAAIDKERCIAPDQLVSQLEVVAHLDVIGSGVAPHEGRWPQSWRCWPTEGPTPLGLWRVAVDTVRHEAGVDAAEVDATYLRASYAELGINVPKHSVWRNPALDDV